MTLNTDRDLLTISEAAHLLKVSTMTLHRWLKQGRLPGYHAGPRKVRIRRADLDKVLTPAYREGVSTTKETMPISTAITIRPLTDEQIQRGREALENADTVIEAIRSRRKGVPLEPSWPLIRKAREERSKQLL